jgi:hypothetical protein
MVEQRRPTANMMYLYFMLAILYAAKLPRIKQTTKFLLRLFA